MYVFNSISIKMFSPGIGTQQTVSHNTTMPPKKASFTVLAGTRGKYGTLPALVGEDKENYDPMSGLRAALPGSSTKGGGNNHKRAPLRDVGFYPLEDPAPSALMSSSSSSSDSNCGENGNGENGPRCGGKLGPRKWRMRSCFDDKENAGVGNAAQLMMGKRGKKGGRRKQQKRASPSLRPLNHSPAASELSCARKVVVSVNGGFASPVTQASIFGSAHLPSPHPLSGDKCGRKIKRTLPSLHQSRHNVCAIR